MAAEATVLLVGLETFTVDQGEPLAPIYRNIPTMGTPCVLTRAKTKYQVKQLEREGVAQFQRVESAMIQSYPMKC